MNKSAGNLVVVALLVGATILLMISPNCSRGCKSILEHLLLHELDLLF